MFALAVAGPRFLPFQTHYVQSGSMRPGLPVGALAFYRPAAASDLHAGDVIVFRRPGSHSGKDLVTHRILRVESSPEGRRFATKGDANSQADPWRIPATGRGWKLWFSVPYAGFAVGMIGSSVGRTWLLSLLAVATGLLVLVELWRRPRSQVASA